MSAAIDYVAEAERLHADHVGVVELIDMDRALFVGEETAAALAERYAVSRRYIERRRRKLRGFGFCCPVYDPSDYCARASAGRKGR